MPGDREEEGELERLERPVILGGDDGTVPRQRWEEHSDSCRIVRDHATRLVEGAGGEALGLALYEIAT